MTTLLLVLFFANLWFFSYEAFYKRREWMIFPGVVTGLLLIAIIIYRINN